MPSAANGKVVEEIFFSSNKINIIFRDGGSIKISKDTFSQFFIYQNKTISNEEYNRIIAYEAIAKSRAYAINLASKRLYTCHQMKEKLMKRGIFSHEADKIIDELKEAKLLSDDKYLEEVQYEGTYKAQGFYKVRQRLKDVSVDLKVLKKQVYNEEEEEHKIQVAYAKAIKMYQNKCNLKKKDSVYKFLINRGFDSELVSKYTSKIAYNREQEQEILRHDIVSLSHNLSSRYNEDELKEVLIKKLLSRGYRLDDIKAVMEEIYE